MHCSCTKSRLWESNVWLSPRGLNWLFPAHDQKKPTNNCIWYEPRDTINGDIPLLRRVVTPKGHCSEGSLLRIEHNSRLPRRVITPNRAWGSLFRRGVFPKGHCSEGSLLRIEHKGHYSDRSLIRGVITPIQHRGHYSEGSLLRRVITPNKA